MRREKHFTFNDCWYSAMTVTPSNWNTQKASLKKPWKITYRFYDPAFKHDQDLWGKQFSIKGMNDICDLAGRQQATRDVMEFERDKLESRGYNPMTGAFMAPLPEKKNKTALDITLSTPWLEALDFVAPLVNCGDDTRNCIRSVLGFVRQSAVILKLTDTPLKDARAGFLADVIEGCRHAKKVSPKKSDNGKLLPIKWNDGQFNYIKSHLGMIFGVLERREVLEYNPVNKIAEKHTPGEAPIIKKRKVLSDSEREKVAKALVDHPEFRRFCQIFFPSGARLKELNRLQGKHVDLNKQGFWVLVKKRQVQAWVFKTITDAALPYWLEVMPNCKPDDFVFSEGLRPGPIKIRSEQYSRYWRRHVKEALGIDVDLYSLKHLFDTEIMDDLMAQETARQAALKIVAEHNNHTSGSMVDKVYDVRKTDRDHGLRKGMGKPFA